jgi:hypothetical protein
VLSQKHHGGIHPRNKTGVGLRLAYALDGIYRPNSTTRPAAPSSVSLQGGSSVSVMFDQGGLMLADTEDCHLSASEASLSVGSDALLPPPPPTGKPPCNYSAAKENTQIPDCCADKCSAQSGLASRG